MGAAIAVSDCGGRTPHEVSGLRKAGDHPARRREWMRQVGAAVISVLRAAAFVAQTLGLIELYRDIMQLEEMRAA